MGVEHQSPIAKTLVFSPEVIGNEGDRVGIEQHVRSLTGRSEAQVLAVRKMVSADGKTLYTANGPSNDVSVIDVASGTVTARIATGGSPWGVLVK